MAATYENFGVRFLYPENWQITDEQSAHARCEVSLQSPAGAFWSLHVYASRTDRQRLMVQVVESMQTEYDSLETRPVVESIGEIDAIGRDMDFFCLDFVVSAKARVFYSRDRTFLVLCQAESRDFENLEPVFQAITVSLLQD